MINKIFDHIKNYKKPETVEYTPTELRAFSILNKKAPPRKQLTLSQKKAYKVLKAPKKLTSSQTKLNKARAIFLKYEQHKKKSRSA